MINYQLTKDSDLPDKVKQAPTMLIDEHSQVASRCMDVMWGYPRFQNLSKVAQQSNAQE